jgi:hypothetical protein
VRLDRPARGVIVAAGVGCVMCPNYAREPHTGGPPPCDPHTNDGLAVYFARKFAAAVKAKASGSYAGNDSGRRDPIPPAARVAGRQACAR